MDIKFSFWITNKQIAINFCLQFKYIKSMISRISLGFSGLELTSKYNIK